VNETGAGKVESKPGSVELAEQQHSSSEEDDHRPESVQATKEV